MEVEVCGEGIRELAIGALGRLLGRLGGLW